MLKIYALVNRTAKNIGPWLLLAANTVMLSPKSVYKVVECFFEAVTVTSSFCRAN